MNDGYEPAKGTRPRRIATNLILVACSGLLLTFGASYFAYRQYQTEMAARFSIEVNDLESRIIGRMRDYTSVLIHTRAFCNAEGNVTRAKFREFVRGMKLEEQESGIQGLGYVVPLASSEQVRTLEARIRREGYPDFRVWPLEPSGKARSAIVYLEPFNWRNQRAFGFDMASEVTRRAAMEQARDSGQVVMSSKVTLVQETPGDEQPGFLMYLPIYDESLPVATSEERRQALRGYVYAAFRARDLFENIFEKAMLQKKYLDIEIYDGAAPEDESTLFDMEKSGRLSSSKDNLLTAKRPLNTAHHRLTLVVAAAPGFERQSTKYLPVSILLVGALITILIVLIFHDAQKEKQRESAQAQAVAVERDRLDYFFKQSPMLVMIFKGPDFMIELANPACHNAFGIDELASRRLCEVIPEFQEQDVLKNFDHVLGTGETYRDHEMPFGLRPASSGRGVTRYLNTVIQPARYHQGGADEIMMLAVDVTDQVQVRRQNEMILNSAGEGIYGLDNEGRTTFVNPAATKMLGWEAAELFGAKQHEKIHHARPDGTRYPVNECPIYAAFHDGTVHHVEGEVFWRKDGTPLPVEYTSTPIRENGKLCGAVVVFRDISDRLRKETELKMAVQARDDFLSIASHELKTPMSALKIQMQILSRHLRRGILNSGSSDQLIKNADLADLQVSRMARLVDTLLDVSRVTAGKFSLEKERVDLCAFIRDLLERLSPQAAAANCKLNLTCSPEVGGFPADRMRLEQVMTNLITNAFRYAPGAEVNLTLWSDAKEVHVAVHDGGPGISTEDQKRIFTRFERLRSINTSGLGLGLYISKQIIEALGGRIRVESEIGKGARFIIDLPLEPASPRQS